MNDHLLGQKEETEPLDEGWWTSLLAEGQELRSSCLSGEQGKDYPAGEKLDAQSWEKIRTLYEQDEVVPFEVRGFNRGGLLVVSDGIQGFVPVSHIVDMPCGLDDDARQAFLADYVGKVLDLKVIECEQAQERIVLSERAAMAGCGKRKQLF